MAAASALPRPTTFCRWAPRSSPAAAGALQAMKRASGQAQPGYLAGRHPATLLHHGPEDDHYTVTGNSGFVFRVFTFYFPGWTAYVDGARPTLRYPNRRAWITFWVPAGTHDVALRLENTPPRWLAWPSACWRHWPAGAADWRLRLPIERPQPQPLALGQASILAAVILAGMIFRAADDQAGWLRVQSTGNQALVARCRISCPCRTT